MISFPPSSKRLRRPAAGFTMTELLITVGVIGIIAVMTVPAFGEWLSNKRIDIEAEQAVATLQRGRMLAAARGQWVQAQIRETGIVLIAREVDETQSPPVMEMVELSRLDFPANPQGGLAIAALQNDPVDNLFFQPNGLVTNDATGSDPLTTRAYRMWHTGRDRGSSGWQIDDDYTVEFRIHPSGLIEFRGHVTQ